MFNQDNAKLYQMLFHALDNISTIQIKRNNVSTVASQTKITFSRFILD